MLPDFWQRELEAALEEVQQVVNDELARQIDQLARSLRDFLYDLFNYPLERPWPESLAIFAEHWTDRGLKLTPKTLQSIWELIAEELDGGNHVLELAEEPAAAVGGFSPASDAILPLRPARNQPSQLRTAPAEQEFPGFESAARQLGRSEQLRLGLTDEERKDYEAFVIQSLHAQARGGPPILPPRTWYDKNQDWLERQAGQAQISGISSEEAERSLLRWKYAHLDELPLDEQRKLRLHALMEERRRYTERYGFLAAFLNPAFDGTGTLNDWAMVMGGFGTRPPPGLDFRSPRPRPVAMPHRGPHRGGGRRLPRRSVIQKPKRIKPSGRRPGRKPRFPPPVAKQRVTIRKGRRTPDPRHVKGAEIEEAQARFIHSLPHEVVIFWGQKIGAHWAGRRLV